MSACCSQSDPKLLRGQLTVALAGNPNSGKTTIFNALTGMKQKVANYPGVTVEKKTGKCKLPDGRVIDIIDLPGTYSLISRSPDELVAMEVLRGLRPDTPAPDVVIVVVDASNLQRNLYLVSQLVELGRPLVVALNMMDIAQRRGLCVSAERLSQQLDVPVIPVVGHKKQGIEDLKEAIVRAGISPMPDWPLPQEMREELLLVGGALSILEDEDGHWDATEGGSSGPKSVKVVSKVDPLHVAGLGFEIPCCSTLPDGPECCPPGNCRAEQMRLFRCTAIAERLLVGDRADDMARIARKAPIASLLQSAESRLHAAGIDPMQADIEAHYQWIEGIAAGSLIPACEVLLSDANSSGTGVQSVSSGNGNHGLTSTSSAESETRATLKLDYAPAPHLSEKVDRILLHKIWGMLVFVAIMGTLFVSIFWLAAPIMDAMKAGVDWLGEAVITRLPAGPIHDLIQDGIFKGVGAVVVFVPQIAILFLFLAILEDSGYLARAAFLMDRLLAKVGLNGKSFIPLLSSFACAIPGILATRTIENRRERLATILVAPFMSCSARLPVYALLIGSFFTQFSPAARGGLLLSLYLLGIVAAVATAWFFKQRGRRSAPSSFILELPTYKIPQWTQVLRVVWNNTKEFLTKAGTTIFVLSVILWGMMYYPRLSEMEIARVSRVANDEMDAHTVSGETAINSMLSELREINSTQPSNHQYSFSAINSSNTKNGLRFHWEEGKLTSEPGRDQYIAQKIKSVQLKQSIAGRIGHFIEPAIKPLGFDWKMGVGLVGAFAAREVFVSTMGIVYSVGEVEDNTQDLSASMQNDRYADGKPVWTPLVAISLLVWFVLAMQCMSTLAIVRRETGGWTWPLFMLIYMNGLAWVVCFAVYQVGRMMI